MFDWAGFQNPYFYSQGVSDLLLFSSTRNSFNVVVIIILGLIFTTVGAIISKLKKSFSHRKLIFNVFIATGLSMLLFWPFINYLGPTIMYGQTVFYANKHKAGLSKLFSQDMDIINSCTSKKEVCDYQANQLVLDAISRDNKLPDFPSTYFVRLTNSGEFEKLFINGTYKKTQITTEKEKLISQFITSGSPFLVSAFIDNAIDATYLNDLYSEAEIFVPVKQNGKTMGIIVRLYGS